MYKKGEIIMEKNDNIVFPQKNLNIENERLIYTVKEVATLLHSSPNYIYQLIEKGFLPALKLGSVKILKSSLQKFLIDNEGFDLSDINNIKKLSIQNL
jgi:DNA binding domain, excisionase family